MELEEKGVEGGEKDEEDIASLTEVAGIKIDPDKNISYDDQLLIGLKRKRERKEKTLKKIPLSISAFGNKVRRTEPSIYQQIFNKVAAREGISAADIRDTASKLNYDISYDSAEFLAELNKARVSVRKLGFPGDICKAPFHVFHFIPFYGTTGLICDDLIVWNAYYSQLFTDSYSNNLKRYANVCKNSKLVEFSCFSNKIFKCEHVATGYCQDYYKYSSIVSNQPVEIGEVNEIKTAITSKAAGTMTYQCEFVDGSKYDFYQYYSLIMCGPSTVGLDTLLQYSTKIKCFNSKNKLSMGVRIVEVNEKKGYYLNLHEQKFTEFSPSCLFVKPGVPDIQLFVSVDLDINEVYNTLAKPVGEKSIKSVLELQLLLPPDAIFWDNINSFVQMVGLLGLIESGNANFQTNAAAYVETYTAHKDVVSNWKRLYKLFEGIVLSYYDSITTRLTIDGLRKLETKVNTFISAYNYLTNDKSFEDMKKFVMTTPIAKMMSRFLLSTAVPELMNALSKLIIIVNAQQKPDKAVTIEDMFRSAGVMCIEVLYGGTQEMIPKVRSRAAFLGNVQGTMDNKTFTKNIRYLLDSLNKEKKKKSEKKSGLSYEELDEVIDRVLDNSFNKIDDTGLTENIVKLKEKIRNDKPLYKSLREDINELIKNDETKADIIADYDFLENPLFNSFVAGFKKMAEIIKNNYKNPDVTKLLDSMKTKGTRKVRKFVKIKNRKKPDPRNLTVSSTLSVSNDALSKMGELKESVNEEAVKKELFDAIGKLIAPSS